MIDGVEFGPPRDLDTLGPAIVIDAETHRIRAEEGVVAPRPVVWAWLEVRADGVHNRRGLILRDDAEGFLRWALSERFTVGHNLAFDLSVMAAEHPELVPLVIEALRQERTRCTQVRQQLIDIYRDETDFRLSRDRKRVPASLSLAALALHWLGVVVEGKSGPDAWRTRYSELDGVPLESWPAAAVEYPILDVIRTAEVAAAQLAWCAREGVLGGDNRVIDEGRQAEADVCLTLMSAWGVRTDPDAVTALDERVTADLKLSEKLLDGSGIFRPDGTRDMAALRRRVEIAGQRAKDQRHTKTGAVSTEADYLREVSEHDDVLACAACAYSNHSAPECPECPGCWGKGVIRPLLVYAEASHARTIHSRELKILRRGTKYPVCANYNVLVSSGRTSASQPNVQNPSRKGGVRECYVPRLGWLFSDVDYVALELRTLAQICLWKVGWSKLAETFREGKDPHLRLAAELLSLSYEETYARRREPQVKAMRQLGKVGNFGYPGGLSAASFIEYAHGYDERLKSIVDMDMSKRLRDGWFSAWTEMRRYFEVVGAETASGSATIKQAWSGRLRGRCRFTQAANTYFQGLAADGAKLALVLLTRECFTGRRQLPGEDPHDPSPLWGCRPVFFIHDQVVMEIPDDSRASERAERHAFLMRAAMAEVCPDVPIEAEPAITRRWYKGAEAVRVDGLLVPSRPENIGGEERWVADVH